MIQHNQLRPVEHKGNNTAYQYNPLRRGSQSVTQVTTGMKGVTHDLQTSYFNSDQDSENSSYWVRIQRQGQQRPGLAPRRAFCAGSSSVLWLRVALEACPAPLQHHRGLLTQRSDRPLGSSDSDYTVRASVSLVLLREEERHPLLQLLRAGGVPFLYATCNSQQYFTICPANLSHSGRHTHQRSKHMVSLCLHCGPVLCVCWTLRCSSIVTPRRITPVIFLPVPQWHMYCCDTLLMTPLCGQPTPGTLL